MRKGHAYKLQDILEYRKTIIHLAIEDHRVCMKVTNVMETLI